MPLGHLGEGYHATRCEVSLLQLDVKSFAESMILPLQGWFYMVEFGCWIWTKTLDLSDESRHCRIGDLAQCLRYA